MNLEEIIPETDISHLVNRFVESIPHSEFDAYYRQYGAPSYHPRMMLKIILYSYTQKEFSGRNIEFNLKDSVRLRWLAQEQTPSYRTINRFRSNPYTSRLLEICFTQFSTMLMSEGKMSSDRIFIDGTKIEANASKYSFVWRKNTERFQASVQTQSQQLYQQLVKEKIIPEMLSDMASEHDGTQVGPKTLNEIHNHLSEIEERLESKVSQTPCPEERKTVRRQRTIIKKTKRTVRDLETRALKYANQLKTLGERNSYSKTDTDATFMRMKDDHMKNGQLKAGYNIQIATNQQYVLGFGIFSNPTDTRTLNPFLTSLKTQYGTLPKYIVADAGYGSENNYESVIDEHECIPIIPYNTFYREQKKTVREDAYRTQNWTYHAEEDIYICPENRALELKRHYSRTDRYGYQREYKIYESVSCEGCPVKLLCKKNESNRKKQIHKNLKYEYFKAKTHQQLLESKERHIYAQRKVDVETTFGNLKANLGYTRLRLRGKSKVHNELGFAFMALNLRKYAKSAG